MATQPARSILRPACSYQWVTAGRDSHGGIIALAVERREATRQQNNQDRPYRSGIALPRKDYIVVLFLWTPRTLMSGCPMRTGDERRSPIVIMR